MRNEVSRQAQAASDARKELERAIKGKHGEDGDSDSDDDEEGSEKDGREELLWSLVDSVEASTSDVEADPVKAAVTQARKQAEAILRGEGREEGGGVLRGWPGVVVDAVEEEEAGGKGGLLGMKFMQRGVERKREEARRQAEDVRGHWWWFGGEVGR